MPATTTRSSGVRARFRSRAVADLGADRDLALLDHVVLVDDQEVAPALVAAERGVRHQQCILLVRRGRARARNSRAAARRSGSPRWRARRACRSPSRRSARRSRACRDADSRSRSAARPRSESDAASCLRDAERRISARMLQHVLLADVEVHVDRVDLDDGGELGRAIGADQLADRHLSRRHDAVERRLHLGVAELIAACLVSTCACFSLAARRIPVGRGIVERDLGGDLAARRGRSGARSRPPSASPSPARRPRRPAPARASACRARARW